MSTYELHKKKIKWNEKGKCWSFSFRDQRYPNGRVNRRSVEWTKSKKYLAEEELRAICDKLDKSIIVKSSKFNDVVDKFMLHRKASGIDYWFNLISHLCVKRLLECVLVPFEVIVS